MKPPHIAPTSDSFINSLAYDSPHPMVVSRDKDGCTPDSVPMVFIVFNLGILGDEKTHKYPLYTAYIIGYVGRGTSNYPLMIRLGIMYRISSSLHVSYRCGAGPGTKPPKNYHGEHLPQGLPSLKLAARP